MKVFSIVFLFFLSFSAYAQKCDYAANFDSAGIVTQYTKLKAIGRTNSKDGTSDFYLCLGKSNNKKRVYFMTMMVSKGGSQFCFNEKSRLKLVLADTTVMLKTDSDTSYCTQKIEGTNCYSGGYDFLLMEADIQLLKKSKLLEVVVYYKDYPVSYPITEKMPKAAEKILDGSEAKIENPQLYFMQELKCID